MGGTKQEAFGRSARAQRTFGKRAGALQCSVSMTSCASASRWIRAKKSVHTRRNSRQCLESKIYWLSLSLNPKSAFDGTTFSPSSSSANQPTIIAGATRCSRKVSWFFDYSRTEAWRQVLQCLNTCAASITTTLDDSRILLAKKCPFARALPSLDHVKLCGTGVFWSQ
jgi:hypothetical protein